MKTKIQTDTRDRLYFDKWKYSIALYQSRISDLRGLDHKKLDEAIKWRSSSKFWQNQYTDEVIKSLHNTLDVIKAEPQPLKLTFSGNCCNLYTNDVSAIERINTLSQASIRYVKQAVPDDPKDVVMLQQSDFSFRSYLRGQWMNEQQIHNLNEFFKTQKEHIKPCNALRLFLYTDPKVRFKSTWLASHYFVEYNDPGYTMMLSLIIPSSVRKTLPIACRINN